MIKTISIKQYRKLKGFDLIFSPEINFISGANGTCKSSLLHMASNSFQRVKSSDSRVNDKKSIEIVYGINSSVNPKIETLTRGDKEYNDPANGVKGTLFSVNYTNGQTLDFRRHNSDNAGGSRYAIKPKYPPKKKEKLPALPVIYLGLTRLYPLGEFQKDSELVHLRQKLPESYQADLCKLYQDLTNIEILSSHPQKMGDVKFRNDFSTNKNGVDSNTISAGEDNILIVLTALISLKYYFETLTQTESDVESLLVIDEFDATLHPALQVRLLELCRQYSRQYKIQIIATTHSLSLIEYALQQGDNVIYLKENLEQVDLMPEPDITKIKMDLKTLARKDIYEGKKIPIFTEDAQARCFLNIILDYWSEKDRAFRYIRNCFHLAEAPLSCEALRHIFKDKVLCRIMRAVCILDGDQNKDIGNYIIALPGKDSPEKFIFAYLKKLYEENSDFWRHQDVIDMGYDATYFRTHILSEIQKVEAEIAEKTEIKNGKDTKVEGESSSKKSSTKGLLREKFKKIWEDNLEFMEVALKYWLNDPQNQNSILDFIGDLNTMFRKTAAFHGINNKEWLFSREISNV